MRPPARKTLLAAALAAFTVLAACSSSSSSSSSDGGGGGHEAGAPAGLGASCALNSDCNDPLVCTFQHCHEACLQTRDCPAGERCIVSAGSNVCELPSEASCGAGSCPGSLVCGPDMQCRSPCQNGAMDCLSGQVCATGLCYDPGDAGTAGDSSAD